MGEFEVEITEILSKKIKLKAKDQHEACKIAKMAYENSEIVLGAEDFVCMDFKTTIASESKTKL